MRKVKVIGFVHNGIKRMYEKPFEYNQIRFANGEFLTDQLIGNSIAKRMDDGHFYLLSSITDAITFDHKLIIEEAQQ